VVSNLLVNNVVTLLKFPKGVYLVAITRDKKQALVAKMASALKESKLTVYAKYQGLSVADMEALRAMAREAGVTITIVKNRLVRVALSEVETYKAADTSALEGQLLYAMSTDDEVAPAQVLDKFAKTHPELLFVGGFSGEGLNISADDLKALAGLPSKNELIAQTIAQLLSPVHDVTNALSGNLHALLDGVEAAKA
jgi:large subunit ribosomal protein L10